MIDAPEVVAKRKEMVHTGAVDFGAFGFDDFDEPEAAYVEHSVQSRATIFFSPGFRVLHARSLTSFRICQPVLDLFSFRISHVY